MTAVSRGASEVLVLPHQDVKRLLPMADCIELMSEALADLARGHIWQPLRFVARPPEEPTLMGLMPAHRSAPHAAYALKAVCIFPGNAGRGLDSHQGGVLLFDGDTGQLRALVDASAVTSIRTAAVSAVATRELARPDSSVLAILGSGVQARAHVEAMAQVRPFAVARVWSRTPEHARALAAEAAVPFPVQAVEAAEEAVRAADVVVTATIAAARLFVDRRESAVNESGEYLRAVEEKGIGPAHIQAELGEVVIGAHRGRGSADELTVFVSLGLAAEDLAAAEYVYGRARADGAGTVVPF